MKFILTQELGRLVKWLRILGYDAKYFVGSNYSRLVIEALRESRTILTRNSHIAEPTGIRLVQIKDDSVKKQIGQVIKDLGLRPKEDDMFSRCTICNEKLGFIDKGRVKEKVPEYVYNTQDEFYCCMSCQRIYWQGSHWGNVKDTLKEVGI
jgi:hypothetical protein